jgi:hypothetical protein
MLPVVSGEAEADSASIICPFGAADVIWDE